MELIFLGTGAGVPSKERNVSSVALTMLQENNSIWLFDCGEATQHQILHTSIRPRKINRIFITHLHGDHIYGLPGFLSSRSFQGGETKLTVYGPKGIRDFIETCLALSGTKLRYPLEIVEVSEGQLFQDSGFAVYCKKLDHGIPCYGYRIVEHDRQGELLADKLKDFGIRPGPVYQQIKDNETIVLEGSQTIQCSQFIGPSKPGRIITIIGDTRNPEQNQAFAADADVLVHEATFEQSMAEMANDYFHSTTAQAAAVARKSNAVKLVLTHISSRYQRADDQRLLAEAQAVFPNTVMARDFTRVTIGIKK